MHSFSADSGLKYDWTFHQILERKYQGIGKIDWPSARFFQNISQKIQLRKNRWKNTIHKWQNKNLQVRDTRIEQKYNSPQISSRISQQSDVLLGLQSHVNSWRQISCLIQRLRIAMQRQRRKNFRVLEWRNI